MEICFLIRTTLVISITWLSLSLSCLVLPSRFPATISPAPPTTLLLHRRLSYTTDPDRVAPSFSAVPPIKAGTPLSVPSLSLFLLSRSPFSRFPATTSPAHFAVKEVDVGLVADLGTLQRLPKIVGFGNAMDLALTGRKVSTGEAKAMWLVSRVFADPTKMDEGIGQGASCEAGTDVDGDEGGDNEEQRHGG
ncbi:uncharacterized protein LOC120283991 [Dioscorea cayenensis subsp. rotundata]|uniref:Uncharacterized protein LOC120283991 n=1 Tax=Dioscorea cayennensis subsp. rotundata TaxID=55577 RepID=A0AB40D346_DIOCR|nr:uncharacterized protein LOC120283991 [Dioscorea cayenensis subsp. rotundata]